MAALVIFAFRQFLRAGQRPTAAEKTVSDAKAQPTPAQDVLTLPADKAEFRSHMEDDPLAGREPANDALQEALRKALAPRYFCLNGHVLRDELQVEPLECPVCRAAIASKCECGHPLDLWYNYRGGSGKPVPGRDYCLRCKRITPWALHRFLNPDGAGEFTAYEESLIDHIPYRPTPEAVGLTVGDLQGTVHGSWLDRIFGSRIHPSDARHPKHDLWLEYLTRSSSFRANVIRRWETTNAQAQLAHGQRLAEEASWKDLSGSQFEKELAWLLKRRGHVVEHVGGPGDSGADLILDSDPGRIVVQCKAYSTRIGPAAVRELFGCLQHHDAVEGWLIGIEGFSEAAQRFAHGKPIRLLTIRQVLDGQEATRLCSSKGSS